LRARLISRRAEAAVIDALRASRFTLEEKTNMELLTSALLSAGFDSSASRNLADGLLRCCIRTENALMHCDDVQGM